ncbi:HYR domain-containing protein [Mangrovimonas cancribranchiae]|uniref:HYR domain-containing protein n=1 Tax=Mangrovimonas cancribranchiae TaxID=3080055 RepID=A0AAU6P914_9FLAO
MKKFYLHLIVCVFISLYNSYGQSGIFESYIVLDTGSGNTYYDLDATTGNPDFGSNNLGIFTQSQQLLLNGGENKTYKCGSDNILNGWLNYRVYPIASVPPAFSSTEIFYNSGIPGASAGCQNQLWQSTAANIDLRNGLPSGDYYIEVYTHADGDSNSDNITDFTLYSNNGGGNYTATFRADNPPVANCISTLTVYLDASGNASITTGDINDGSNDDFDTPTLSLDIDTFDCSNIGTPVTVTLTAEDSLGQTDSCTTIVTVLDNTPPTPDTATLSNITAQCEVTALTPPSATDNCTAVTVTHNASLPITTQGTTVVTWTYEDGNGNTSTQNQNVIINDDTAPTPDTASLGDITAQCEVTALTPPSATDNCTAVTVTHNASLPITTQGTTVVTWTYEDGNGNTSTQNQNVIINDDTAPTPDTASLGDITAQCEVTALTPPSATDNCTTVTVIHNASLPITTQGTTVVTWTYEDGNGNTSTQNQNVIINDNTAPTPDTASLGDITAQCEVTALTPPSATDNCTTVTVIHNASLPITTQGTTVVTWTYEDGNGNTSTQNQNVIINDDTAPTPDTASLGDITAQCEVTALTPPSATDNCTTVTVIHNASLPITTQGTTVVTWTYEDGNGNTSTQNQNVIINDNTAPTPDTASLGDITAQCEVTALTPPSATDNCTTVTVIHNASLPITTQGTTVVTWTYEDGNGNTSTQNQNVIINDDTTPTPDVASLGDITAQCEVTALTPPSATDNCTAVTVTHNATLPITTQGTTVVTWTYEDGNGNTSTQNQNVVITDITNPTITCPSDITTTNDIGICSAVVTYTTPSGNDNCGIQSITQIAGLASGSAFPVGTTTNTFQITDVGGNSTTCSFTVTVNDNENPSITCPSDITINTSQDGTGNCSTTAFVGALTANDNCSIDDVYAEINGSEINPNTYIYPVGNTTITWHATDVAGNTSQCDQIITVIDNEDPIINCIGDQNVSYDTNCNFTLQDYTSLVSAYDNCDNNVTITQTPSAGDVIYGAVTVTITAVDDSNRTSTCTFDVIPSDNQAPTAVCQDYTAVLSSNGTITVAATNLNNGSTDNCSIANMTVTPNSFSCSDVGPNTVTFTVYDNAGNSDSCTATITVVDDTAPTMLCSDYVVVIDAITREATIQASDIDNGSYDACGIASLTVSPSVFPEAANGLLYTTTTTLTAVDSNGNTNTCTANVTVEPPKNLFTHLTGEIVNPVPDNPQPPSSLIEVTACPGDLSDPRDIELTLHPVGTYNLQASDVLWWEYSTDNGETWTQIPNTAGILTYTLLDVTMDTFVRLVLQDPDNASVTQTSAEAYIRFLPPDEPPIIVDHTELNICLNDFVSISAESFFDQPNGQFGEGGEFNYAQPDGWRVDGVDGDFPASGNNTNQPTWKETNSNNNRIFSGINYDTNDNTKFAMANGVANYTTLETPVFSTIGMTSSEAILNFETSFYFCNGGRGEIWLSFDSGATYTVQLSTIENYDFDSTSGGTTTSGVILASGQGNRCIGQTSPRMLPASLNLGPYAGLSGLRVMFKFYGSNTDCGTITDSTFPNPNNINCSGNGNNANTLASGWAVDRVGFAYAQVDDELEWTDEDNNVIAVGTSATVTPITPGIRTFGVTTLVNGCRTNNNDGTNFIDIHTSLAYAGQDYTPLNSECGENALQLNAYDNTITAVENYNKGAWVNNLYTVPDIAAGDTDYPGTGITGQWSIESSSFESCGTNALFSSISDPDATFTADPGTYTLRWTLANGCFDDITVTIKDCPRVDFDGTNDFVSFKNNYNLNNSFSIEVWVKPHSITNTKTVFSRKDANNNNNGYAINIVNGIVEFKWYNLVDSGTVSSGSYTINTDRWYHLAITFDGALYTLYVDGIPIDSANGSAPELSDSNIKALLGAMDASSTSTPINYFHGWLDELRIWNKALSVEHIRQMMNQEIVALGSDVGGTVIPTKIYGPDLNNDGIEDNPLLWSNLVGYYRMNLLCGDLSPYKGVSGRLRNITTSQQQTAPLPYTTRVANQSWGTDNTWTFFDVWDTPNSNGINGEPIDWNIVSISHNISTHNQDITLLGLLVNNGEVTVSNPGSPQDETNTGQMLWVTHYLDLDGKIDLVGESQLIQKRYYSYYNDDNDNTTPDVYTTYQFNESIFNNSSLGYLERDQQGTTNPFNYNYWGSPVAPNNASLDSNNNTINTFSIGDVLRDGTTTVDNPINRYLNWTGNYTASASNPAQVSRRWLYAYVNNPANSYADWEYKSNTGSIPIGLGFTMKGSGNTSNTEQNYVFVGKPNNGTIVSGITASQQSLVGNPYPSAIDSRAFILDNQNSITGTLYFWEHYTSNATHVTELYEGGYAALNFTGGVGAVQHPDLIASNNGTKIPERYIPVAQGFYVEAGTNNGEVVFKNSQRVYKTEAHTADSYDGSIFIRQANTNNTSSTTSNTMFSNDPVKRVRLNFLSPENGKRPLLLGFVPNNLATYNVDYAFDGRNTDESTNSDMSWLIENEKYTIQGVGDFDSSHQFPVSIFVEHTGLVKIELESLENFNQEVNVFVYDILTGTYSNINNMPFEMHLDSGEYSNRFYITFENDSTLSIIDEAHQNIMVNYLQSTNEIYVKTPQGILTKQVQLINLLGQTVFTWNATNKTISQELKIPVRNISEGSYIIKVLSNNNHSVNKKVIIKQ